MAYVLSERDLVELRMLLEHVKGMGDDAGRISARLAGADGAELEQLRASVSYVLGRMMGLAARADLARDLAERLARRARVVERGPSYATPGEPWR